MRDPDTLDDLSKERFEGTVLKAISKNVKIKEELREEPVGASFGPVRRIPAEVLVFFSFI